jgi:uncharacterized protein
MERKVELTNVSGRQVFTILTEPDEPTGRLLIMAHGFRGHSTGPARTFVDLERLLIADGIACLRFDQPGSGNSEGDFYDSSFNAWVDTIAELARSHLQTGRKVALLGQSMGGSASIIATARQQILGGISAVILWAPGANDNFEYPDESYLELPFPDADYVEENGQRVGADYWRQAHQAGFYRALDGFDGAIHLVYGEHDQFDPDGLRSRVIDRVRAKGQPVTILAGQGHSSWDYALTQDVYRLEREFLKHSLA